MGVALSYLLDSVILIDHLNGIDEATEFLAQHQPECALSVITRAEASSPAATASSLLRVSW